MWNKKSTDLVTLSRSWTHVPDLANLKGADGGYSIEQMAYILRVSGTPVTFTVNASETCPVHNLCFVLKGWGSKDDAKISAEGSVKQGTVRDTIGTCSKLIFI